MGKWLRKKLQNFVFSHVYNGVVEGEVLLYDNSKGVFVHNGKRLDKGTTELLVAQAKQILQMKATDILLAELKAVASKKVYQAQDQETALAGKMMFHAVYTLQKKLYNMARLPIK